MKVRAAQEDDVPEIAALIERHAQEVVGESELSEAEIRRWFSVPRIWIRVAERNGHICGYLDYLKRTEESPLDIYLCAPDGDAARALLTAVTDDAGSDTYHVFAYGTDALLNELLDADGWRLARHSFQMRIELNGELPEPAWPDGITVRPFRPGEERRVYEANNAAFSEEWFFDPFPFEEWWKTQSERSGFDPELWWLAEAGEELAGLSLNRWSLSGDREDGWVASLGVLPTYRRRGLGEALLRHSFHDFRARGARRVGLGVDTENETGAVRLYERVGMHIHRRDTTWEKEL